MTQLYVGNLSWATTPETLRTAFGADGRSVKDVNIINEPDSGKPRGFAFVEMGSKDDADQAIKALHGTSLDGRAVRVNVAAVRTARAGVGRRIDAGGAW